MMMTMPCLLASIFSCIISIPCNNKSVIFCLRTNTHIFLKNDHGAYSLKYFYHCSFSLKHMAFGGSWFCQTIKTCYNVLIIFHGVFLVIPMCSSSNISYAYTSRQPATFSSPLSLFVFH